MEGRKGLWEDLGGPEGRLLLCYIIDMWSPNEEVMASAFDLAYTHANSNSPVVFELCSVEP